MNITRPLILAATLGALSLGAHATMAVNAADLPRISNGGTGYIGLAASAGSPRSAYQPARSVDSSVPLQAGEASTMLDGVPNQLPAGAMQDRRVSYAAERPELRTMGQSGRAAVGAHPLWGTPD